MSDRAPGVHRGPGGGRARGSEPQRLGDILSAALGRMATSEQGRAYAAWARAAGAQVASGARPRHFSRGVLTVECTSSVWANELTYLGGQILRRMDGVAPGHPVKRFRFVVERAAPRQQQKPPAAREEGRYERPAPADLGGARAQAQGVRDERLRAAIEAALRTSSAESPETPGDGPHGG
ncbi:MAG: DciA family protein [Actinomycetes bacterium]